MTKNIYFDMDGTITDLYGVPTWLEEIRSFSVNPYIIAKPIVNMSALARRIHALEQKGYVFNVITWVSMVTTPEYTAETAKAKKAWLQKHLPSVQFENIIVTEYGVPKSTWSDGNSILFDDNADIRNEWMGYGENVAYDARDILEILKQL